VLWRHTGGRTGLGKRCYRRPRRSTGRSHPQISCPNSFSQNSQSCLLEPEWQLDFERASGATGCGKTQRAVILRFAQNGKTRHFFRGPSSRIGSAYFKARLKPCPTNIWNSPNRFYSLPFLFPQCLSARSCLRLCGCEARRAKESANSWERKSPEGLSVERVPHVVDEGMLCYFANSFF
jgi:hypothetical protein